MKAVIIEDETTAVNSLKAILAQNTVTQIEVIAELESIEESVDFFRTSPHPDIIFMDIHLADGSAFKIFEQVEIDAPVVFTTAYDEYALQAFQVSSIDYLLKPIGRQDIEQALEKLTLFSSGNSKPTGPETNELVNLMRMLKKQESYKTHFLIPIKGDKLLPVSVDMILLFYIRDCQVKAVLTDGTEYSFPQTLDELTECLDPTLFFRANRQYLLSREAIKDIDLWFNSRLSINLRHSVSGEKILVSKARVAEFKEWFSVK